MLSQVTYENACLSCGACCAYCRVSFYWAEGEQIPEHLVEPITPVYSCMKGTNQTQPRCQALEGTPGEQVSCSIYSMRSSSCQEVQAGDSQCNKARSAHGMIPLINIEPQVINDESYDQVS